MFANYAPSEESNELCSDSFELKIKLEQGLDKKLYAVFEIDMNKESWYGFGFGLSMKNCDMVLFEAR